ncbi:MAG: hypothetical protein GWO08_01725 [Gammaproteobacteria bacterium]|nr:hypothetical protein [candidate division Zixibacteria bacterium]NIR92423.1 hypothetical protein [Gammaproteobacteria bacterium]NIR62908.1 hypothetical protein [candidate division Zixibacteria bacterium]NIS46985.1 hypothetical protein [candidate division Zixibacteria bacterium]NIU15137.1 hypothetical protein [candidate division Zixibacteria bacterium]
MKHYMKLSFYAWSVALFLVLVCALPTSAQTVEPEDIPRDKDGDPDCRECHWETFLDWEHSSHGKGLSCPECHLSDENHARLGHGSQGGAEDCMFCHTTGYNAIDDTWEEDNIHCKACHTPVEVNHPNIPMPTNRSGALCGGCHIQAFFEWQESEHHNAEVACIDCHSQHTTDLRFNEAIETCAQCHLSLVEEFHHSGHETAGITCADCHLTPLEGPIGSGSAKLDHTFMVELNTCTACHLEELHGSKQAGVSTDDNHLIAESINPDPMTSSVDVEVTQVPRSANPLTFITFFGLIALGMTIIRYPSLVKKLPWGRKKESADE